MFVIELTHNVYSSRYVRNVSLSRDICEDNMLRIDHVYRQWCQLPKCPKIFVSYSISFVFALWLWHCSLMLYYVSVKKHSHLISPHLTSFIWTELVKVRCPVNPLIHKVAKMVAWAPDRHDVKIKKPWVRPVWRRTPLFYVTILATLCIKGLSSVQFSWGVWCELPFTFSFSRSDRSTSPTNQQRSSIRIFREWRAVRSGELLLPTRRSR